MSEEERNKFGILIANQYGVQEKLGQSQSHKLDLIKQMNHIVPALMAMEHGIKGHVGMTTMASAGGAIAIGEAYRLVKHGYCDRIIAGGLDLNVTPLCHGGMDSFGALTRSFNENP